MSLFLIISPILAATNDFTADGNITVSGVTFGSGTADMLIMNGSTAESWEFSGGSFTVTNPGTFNVGSSDSSVKSIKITQGATDVACGENTSPGTSYVTLPTAAATYTIVPYTTTDCTSLCDPVDNAATLNSFPTCGAATCNTGYTLSGSGSSATCVSAGGAVIITPPEKKQTSSQSYDPLTGKLTVNDGDNGAAKKADNQKQPETAMSPVAKRAIATLKQITDDAETISSGDVNKIIKAINKKRDLAAEINYGKTIVAKIAAGSGVASETRNTITSFVAYGTKTTQALGAGERGGVINSFKASFGKLPEDLSDWLNVIKIANGRWPDKTSERADNRALINFRIVYSRDPDKSNPSDNAAVTIMAYGLRPTDRNLDSEKAAIKIFRNIYGYIPKKATAWDVVRAIAYSGATR